jgi:glyoxylase-like metal-dependent hydrolase (beta-lactamase superfamily II)
LPYAITEIADLETVAMADVALRAVHTPGPQPEHLAFLVVDHDGTTVAVTGDLDGRRGARSIVAPPDEPATIASRDRLRGLAPEARWLGGHPRD